MPTRKLGFDDGPQPKRKKEKAPRAVLVTTEFRGVFFGYLEGRPGETVRLSRARLCVYWSADMRGFMGLAEKGPSSSCRIGPPANVELRKVTAICEVSPSARDKWEAAPWQN